ncbi:hypothetical protein [Natronolimnobius baerhuensis]|uniref:Uncharacterized protein n=1 Tax=Natronolimnobius baerhuensis TaxID=253108 RepID=A0A202E938_9EURY|nr:hypothetical protein [Natronolimnobius baerhuensis]OVE84737.1 hypothetical protein B2G88_10160 [Natronolimnobius baerhuensis]
MSANRFTFPDAVDTDTVQSVGKLVLATVALVWLLWLVSMLPGVGRFIPGTPVTFAALVGAIATVLVVGLLLYLAPALAGLVRSTVDGPENVVDDVASITHLFIVLVAVLVAHRGLAQLLVPLLENPLGLGNAGWTYDIVFLALALPPLAILAARIYVSLDPMSELLAKKLTKADDSSDEFPTADSKTNADDVPLEADSDTDTDGTDRTQGARKN